jgi:DUF971 family protein
MKPTRIRLVRPDLLTIEWTDGTVLEYPTAHLRAHCPCAHCTEGEETPASLLERFPDARILAIDTVGQYALQIGFTDGHRTGIYTYIRLKTIGYPLGQSPVPKVPDTFEV